MNKELQTKNGHKWTRYAILVFALAVAPAIGAAPSLAHADAGSTIAASSTPTPAPCGNKWV